MEKILDDDYLELDNLTTQRLLESIRWWEGNRLLFNSILAISGALPFFLKITFLRVSNLSSIFIMIIGYFIFMNILFCIGWGIDIIKLHYFKSQTFGKYKVQFCFWGMLFSAVFTFISFAILI